MTKLANGTFKVTMVPQAHEAGVGDSRISGVALGKIFSGDLSGTSSGQMLAVHTAVEGSTAYVAMEHVVGALCGLEGSFALQHSGIMARGTPTLSITVVPDSGTGRLTGIAGIFEIAIVEGTHRYAFEYTLPGAGWG